MTEDWVSWRRSTKSDSNTGDWRKKIFWNSELDETLGKSVQKEIILKTVLLGDFCTRKFKVEITEIKSESIWAIGKPKLWCFSNSRVLFSKELPLFQLKSTLVKYIYMPNVYIS